MRCSLRRVVSGSVYGFFFCFYMYLIISTRRWFRVQDKYSQSHVEIKRTALTSSFANVSAGLVTVHALPAASPTVVQITRQRSTSEHSANLWPQPDHPWDDRILNQLNHVPRHYGPDTPMKLIYIEGKTASSPKNPSQEELLRNNCPVDRCLVTNDDSLASSADAVLMKATFGGMPKVKERRANQIWVIRNLESPSNTNSGRLKKLSGLVNWTATYRSDSTIVTPYEKFVPFENITNLVPAKNFASGKSKMVAWFASHCQTPNRREDYISELRKYIDVDVYGGCGSKRCPKSERACFEMLKNYRFYLSFENSNCDYYITEKLFINGFMYETVPIVLGARREDYLHVSPPNSFIFAGDFKSPKKLAEYLMELSKNPEEYSKYLAWTGRGHFINTKFICRVCTLLHSVDSEQYVHTYDDLAGWWFGVKGQPVCSNGKLPWM